MPRRRQHKTRSSHTPGRVQERKITQINGAVVAATSLPPPLPPSLPLPLHKCPICSLEACNHASLTPRMAGQTRLEIPRQAMSTSTSTPTLGPQTQLQHSIHPFESPIWNLVSTDGVGAMYRNERTGACVYCVFPGGLGLGGCLEGWAGGEGVGSGAGAGSGAGVDGAHRVGERVMDGVQRVGERFADGDRVGITGGRVQEGRRMLSRDEWPCDFCGSECFCENLGVGEEGVVV
ncbi:hypothetical protein J1614_005855 [Plenodomus biglobosus]|nr:hypothetical protein J1614_005855 [Plenodomus biglobosus]